MSAQAKLAGPEARMIGDWRHGAACTAVDPELFFPAAAAGRARAEQEAAAKAVCAGCPVLTQCRQWALTQLPHGVAGGLTEDERRDLRTRTKGRTVVPITTSRREQPAPLVNSPADGSRGGNRAPVLISHHNAQAGTALEGHRG